VRLQANVESTYQAEVAIKYVAYGADFERANGIFYGSLTSNIKATTFGAQWGVPMVWWAINVAEPPVAV
jgi:hypothetical protein